MNILFYMHQFPGFGGMETIAAVLAKEFLRRGYTVSFLSHQEGKKGTSVMTQLPPEIACYKMPDKRALVSEANRVFVKKLVRDMKIDVILFRDSYMPIEKNILGCNVGARIITSEHSQPFFCYEGAHPGAYTLVRRIYRALRWNQWHSPSYYEGKRKRYLYDKSDAYVLLSNRFYGEFKSVAKLFDSRKLRAVNNPLSPELKPQRVDLDSKQDLMVFAGTLSAEKGAMRALSALKILKDRGGIPSGWRFEIIGDGPEREICEQFISSNKLDFVSLMGYVANPQPFFERAKILLFPSSREGFGNVLFEAQANGCVPVAFSSYSSVFDIIQHGVNGFVVDAFDIEKYVAAIESLIVDNSKWHTLAKEAVKAANTFDLCGIADEWERLLMEVI